MKIKFLIAGMLCAFAAFALPAGHQNMKTKITILGSCSGTEPMPNRHQTAVAIECGDAFYLFDAGENAAYTACMAGVNMGGIRAVFLSHLHGDHTCGLPYLFQVLRKIHSRHYCDLSKTVIKCLVPPFGEKIIDMSFYFANGASGELSAPFRIETSQLHPGTVYQDDRITVEAINNGHLSDNRSFSFRISVKDQVIVLSGDVKSVDELKPFFDRHVNLFFMETGHHDPVEVCRKASGWNFDRLIFYHHGRALLADDGKLIDEARKTLGKPLDKAYDAMKIEL